jgi:hypothetical protein
MATKKKMKKKQGKVKRAPGKKAMLAKNRKSRSPKKALKKKATRKKAPAKASAVAKKATARKATVPSKKRTRGNAKISDTNSFSLEEPVSRSGGQSGDLQGLSDIERADSESVDELLEEGNAFEADAVLGVQRAGDAEGREVHTHEVPEDDVPAEYLDEE